MCSTVHCCSLLQCIQYTQHHCFVGREMNIMLHFYPQNTFAVCIVCTAIESSSVLYCWFTVKLAFYNFYSLPGSCIHLWLRVCIAIKTSMLIIRGHSRNLQLKLKSTQQRVHRFSLGWHTDVKHALKPTRGTSRIMLVGKLFIVIKLRLQSFIR